MLKFFRWQPRRPDTELGGIPTVHFDRRHVTREVKEQIRADIDGLPAIPTQLRESTYEIAVEAASRGGDLHILTKWLTEQDVPGMDRAEAAHIATFICDRACARMQMVRYMRLGITEGIWLHSGISCFRHRKPPGIREGYERLSEEHQSANGKRYILKDGLTIMGSPAWPRMDDGCLCICKPVIPGFEE